MGKKVTDAESNPGFAGNFSIKDAAKVGLQYMKWYSELEASTKIKSILAPMLEKARLDEVRFSQNLFVVDAAQPPDKKSKPKKSFVIAGAFAGSTVLAVFIVLLWNSWVNFYRRYKSIS